MVYGPGGEKLGYVQAANRKQAMAAAVVQFGQVARYGHGGYFVAYCRAVTYDESRAEAADAGVRLRISGRADRRRGDGREPGDASYQHGSPC